MNFVKVEIDGRNYYIKTKGTDLNNKILRRTLFYMLFQVLYGLEQGHLINSSAVSISIRPKDLMRFISAKMLQVALVTIVPS